MLWLRIITFTVPNTSHLKAVGHSKCVLVLQAMTIHLHLGAIHNSFFFFLNAETGNKEDFQATNSRNELLIQTAGITEQTTNQRTFTDPSNKVTIRRVPKQIQNFNRKIMLLVG